MPSSFVLILLVTGVFSAISTVFAWLRKDEPGGNPLVIFQFALVIGIVTYAIDVHSTNLSTQYLFTAITLVAQAIVGATWVYVAIEYSGLDRWANRRTAGILAIEPVVLAIAFVTPMRQLVFTPPASGVTGSIIGAGAAEPGPLMVVHLLFTTLVTAVGSLLFLRLFMRSRHLYRTQAAAVAIAAAAPWVILILDSTGVTPGGYLSVVGWAISGIALTGGLYRFKTLDPIPTAKDAVVEKMGTGVIVLDEDDIVGECNPAARAFLDSNEMVGQPISEVFEGWADIDYPDAETTDWQEIELTVDGERRFLDVQVSVFTDRFDTIVGRLVVLRDVTDRTKRQRELARFEQIFESVTDRVYVLDEAGTFVMVNDPFASLVGTDPASLEGTAFDAILASPSDHSTGDGGESEGVVEVAVETVDGEEIPCETRQAPISFEGVEAGTVGILRDVSRRKELESSLRETTQQLETIVEASPLAVIGMDTDGRVEVWNPAATEIFGWSAQTVRGVFPPIVADEREEEFRDLLDEVRAGERITGHELTFDCNDESQFDGSLSLAPIKDETGAVSGVVAIVADITDQKERQRKLEAKNERLDQFASMISHDLRNPLSSAKGYLDLAKTRDEEGDFEKVERAHDRMEQMIDDLLTLARVGAELEDADTVTLASLARDAWDTAQTDEASLETEIPEETTVNADPDLLRNVFENVYRNAVDHNDDEVTVRVGTFNNGHSGFFVEDDGAGIDSDERDDVFDHGYSTDRDGTGFGLSIVNDIADAHDWDVSVTDGTAGGARFVFETEA
jgi:PAS domain S-box-containing protein